MRGKLLLVPAIAVCLVGAGSTGAAEASGKARTSVTIKAQGTDLSGTVTSKKPYKCANDRTVILVKQVGKRGGGNDVQVAYDDASYENGAYRWSTGNTGMEGRFYAKVKATYKCKGDTSKTVWALSSD